MTIQKTNLVEEILETIKSNNIQVIGPHGSGKKMLVQQAITQLKSQHYNCIECCFDPQFVRNTDLMLNIVHQLAQAFESHNYERETFDLVDLVNCQRFDLLPRHFFSPKMHSSLMSEVFSISEKLVDLTSLGVAPKVLNITQSIYKLAKNTGQKQEIRKLKEETREELLDRFKLPIFSNQKSHVIVVLSQFDQYPQECQDYIHSLAKVNDKIKFIYITHEAFSGDFHQIPVHGFDYSEVCTYLSGRFGSTSELQDFFPQDQAVLPSYLEAFCMIFEKHENSATEIQEILNQDNSLWESISKDLTQEKKDILLLLALCDEVDIHIFELFFENLYFGNYTTWFQSPLFHYQGDKVQVKHYYKNAIIPHDNKLLLQSYYKKLIQVYLKRLDQNICKQNRGEVCHKIGVILELCRKEESLHPMEQATASLVLKFDILNKYWPLTGLFGLESLFIQEYIKLYQDFGVTHPANQMVCRGKIIQTYISQGKYDLAEDYLLSDWTESQASTDLIAVVKASLIYYQNRPKESLGEKRSDIVLAERLLDLYENVDANLELKYDDFIYLNTYIAKAYMAGIDPQKSRAYLNKAQSVPQEAVTIFKLYQNMAYSYMVSGELYTLFQQTEEASLELKQAVDFYKYAIVVDQHDLTSKLNLGLVNKRISENYQRKNQVDQAERYMQEAISIYEEVRTANPTLIDVYQKIGYAYSELSIYLHTTEKKESSVHYCNQAIQILNTGLDYLTSIGEDHRQIRNALCQANRNLFQMTGDSQHLLTSLHHGRHSILCAKENALGYMEFHSSAKCALETPLWTLDLEQEVGDYVEILKKNRSRTRDYSKWRRNFN